MSIKNRIAFYFTGIAAFSAAFMFLVIYFIVYNTVYTHLDEDLSAELNEVSSGIVYIDGELIFTNDFEWNESEHGQIEVNPTFIQAVDINGNNLRKSANLRDDNLIFNPGVREKTFLDYAVAKSFVRQVQSPIISDDGNIRAYVIVAIPLEESALVLANLKKVLLISFPLIVLILFALSRSIAGNVIMPVNNVISTAELITRVNLNERITLPRTKDELHKLSTTINRLLDRLQDAVQREKQFTADASHELRTPISVIRGTLEVLIRKQRDPQQYEDKIKNVITEVDRMSVLVEQLLMLARYESSKVKPMKGEFDITRIINSSVNRFQDKIEEKKLQIELDVEDGTVVNADYAMTEIVLENLISNAVKYSAASTSIPIKVYSKDETTIFSITNYGGIIPPEKLPHIFDRFYRIDSSRNSATKGNGLGLAIVKKLVDIQEFEISVESSHDQGTTFNILFHT